MHRKKANDYISNSVPTVSLNAKVEEVLKLFLNRKYFESISYVYVLDDNKFAGQLKIEEILKNDKSEKIKKLIEKKPKVSVSPENELRHVALKAMAHNLTALPVVDESGKFLGAITTDTTLKTLDSKAVAQILRHGGINISHQPDIYSTTIKTSLKHRLPWLLAGLIGGIATAGIITGFEKTLEQNLVLAIFIPLIVYMADAIGNQMEAFVIRDLDKSSDFNFKKYIGKQLEVVGIIAFILSVIIFIFSLISFDSMKLSFVIAIGLFCASISSVITGVMIPFIFSKLKLDPADASGPIATIIQDFSSLLIYFTIATIFL
ncbi:MAG TPA: magnesium transporter [Candidatus Dojkabacteria bacterium]|nr:magnesium transporter [Candidatus Dojkabacteria bacterium]HRP36998.1 magnesium transporter [Candidatus Dojkabacteria bacterium]HRP51348.1 magnesium transporter [Candidatus Dojkabacteria bacterium]